MNGTGNGTFSPNADTTRGMIVTMLARLEGVSTSGTPWYAAGQKWAMDAGISDGTNMTGAITREQLAAILFRYAKQKGYDVSKSVELNGFEDAAHGEHLCHRRHALGRCKWPHSGFQQQAESEGHGQPRTGRDHPHALHGTVRKIRCKNDI